ncbi:MAG: hypothetical protein KKE20_04185 [Nanoarchaeota archaeon]|nr:hypothetical protein [Nanoarchaeota archaeon]
MKHCKRGVNLFLMLVVIISLFFLSSCSGGFGNPKSGEARTIDYHTGSQGLVLRFLPGSPPPSLYKGDYLSVVVEYSNKGAYKIQGGQLYISGYDPAYTFFSPSYYTSLTAEGKSEFNPLGDLSNTHEFYVNAVSLPPGVDVYSPKFLVTACYKYKTEAYKDVCIDPDPWGIAPKEKICTVHDVAFGTQGAPVAVTSVEEVSSKDRVQFKVHVSNVGGGTVIDNVAPITQCNTRLKRSDIDKVSIIAKFSNNFLTCEPATIPLINGNGISVCTYSGRIADEAFLTVLNIELYYGYRTSIQGSTSIYDIPGG